MLPGAWVEQTWVSVVFEEGEKRRGREGERKRGREGERERWGSEVRWVGAHESMCEKRERQRSKGKRKEEKKD
jgi:hypothetical protein